MIWLSSKRDENRAEEWFTLHKSSGRKVGLTRGFIGKRTVGLGDTLFALNAIRAFKQAHPRVPVWFDFGGTEWEQLRPWLPDILEQVAPPTTAPVVDFDTVPTDADACRYKLMAEMLGVEVDSLSLPWDLPASWMHRVAQDYPHIGDHVLLAPWCGGSAVTRSLPDQVIHELLDQDEFPVLLQHPQPHEGFDGLPNTILGDCPLPRTAALCAQAKAVVAVDTGSAYLAASMGVPTVVVFTHIAPEHRLLPQSNVAWVTPDTLDCGPCGDFEWPPKCPDGGLAQCAVAITSESILGALRGIV